MKRDQVQVQTFSQLTYEIIWISDIIILKVLEIEKVFFHQVG